MTGIVIVAEVGKAVVSNPLQKTDPSRVILKLYYIVPTCNCSR